MSYFGEKFVPKIYLALLYVYVLDFLKNTNSKNQIPIKEIRGIKAFFKHFLNTKQYKE